jgi:hypothetical protein
MHSLNSRVSLIQRGTCRIDFGFCFNNLGLGFSHQLELDSPLAFQPK